MLNIQYKIIFVLLCALSFTNVLVAQTGSENIKPKINSPFSRFGLGDLSNSYFTAMGAMGGYTTAYNDPFHINLSNPASLAYLKSTAFEVGLSAKSSRLNDVGNESGSFISGNLEYLALGFPLKNTLNQVLDRKNSPWQFGSAISLQPYSVVGYDIITVDVNEGTGSTTNVLKGTGGTYRFNWGTAARYNNIAVGINMGYQFGKITNSRLVSFDTLSFSYFTEFRNDLSITGFVWNVGLQYTYEFKKANKEGVKIPDGRRFIFGITGNNKRSFTSTSTNYIKRENFYYPGAIVDTILYEPEKELKGVLPSALSLGIAYEDFNKVKLGIEYSISKWGKYTNEAKPDILSDTWRFAIGGEFIPNATSYNRYLKKVRYRAGFYTGTDARSLQGEQLKYSAITFGLGMPIIMSRQRVSFVNLSFEYGTAGLKDVLNEKYFKFTLGFTLNDNSWFFKRKFN